MPQELPKPEHARLRERLLRLEDIHGDATRKRFPQPTSLIIEIFQEPAI